MADQGDKGWQLDKTVLECNRYMLDHEIATDVCFEVGPLGGVTVDIRAHKYMLISRSPVFQTMFCSLMVERQSDVKIRIEDVTAEAFKDMLSFIYCESVEVSDKTAASLMFAGKKFMLPKLVKECGHVLEKTLNENNVCHIFEQSLKFDDKDLAANCLNVISRYSDHILKGTEFPTASYDVIEAILRMDELESSEVLVYESCIGWAKYQLQTIQSVENPSEHQIRETLGGLLYKIRFPTMQLEEFATITGKSDILLDGEKLSIYYYFAKKDNADQLLFSAKDRRRSEVWIDRIVTCTPGCWNNGSAVNVNAVAFATDNDIDLTGIGLYAGYDGNVGLYAGYDGNGYLVTIEILQGTNGLFKKEGVTVPVTGNSDPIKIPVDQPVKISSGVTYTILVSSSNGSLVGYYGNPCQGVCKSDERNVTFTFSNVTVPGKTNSSTTIYGQIPRIYFK